MRVLVCTVICGVALALGATSRAFAQTPYPIHPEVAKGIASYERGDFTSALAILKPFVYEPAVSEPERQVHAGIPNIWAMLYVARMLGHGQGAALDRVAACGFLKMAHIEFSTLEVDPAQPFTNPVRSEMEQMCIGVDEADIAGWQSSCFAETFDHLEFLTQDSRLVVVNRNGIRIVASQRTIEHEIPRASCGELTVAVQYTPLVIRREGVDVTRNFIEIFAWTRPKAAEHNGERLLRWRVLEILDNAVRPAPEQTIATLPSSVQPAGILEPEIRGAVRLSVTGERVEWTIAFGPTRRGWVR